MILLSTDTWRALGGCADVCSEQDVDADATLAMLAAGGDDEAFRQIVQRYQHRVYRTALAMTGNETQAEDLTQEVFVKLYRNLHRFQRRSKFSTWFYRLSMNTLHSCLRSRKYRWLARETPPERADSAAGPRTLAREQEDRARIVREIMRLPRLYREVISLVFLQGCSYEEAAEVLDIPLGTMKNRLFRARKLLQERLTATGILDELS